MARGGRSSSRGGDESGGRVLTVGNHAGWPWSNVLIRAIRTMFSPKGAANISQGREPLESCEI